MMSEDQEGRLDRDVAAATEVLEKNVRIRTAFELRPVGQDVACKPPLSCVAAGYRLARGAVAEAVAIADVPAQRQFAAICERVVELTRDRLEDASGP